jgi:PKD repeat protein
MLLNKVTGVVVLLVILALSAFDSRADCMSDVECPACQWCNVLNCQDQPVGSDLKDDCPAGECLTGAQAPLVCDDRLYCNGAESCDPVLGCRAGSDPCDDSDVCTTDSCNEVADECSHVPVCDDGLYCNGAEICDAVGRCVAGMDPCDDSDVCTIDSCDEGADECAHVPDPGCHNEPHAVLGLEPESGPAPLEVTFDGSQSTAPPGRAITEYRWDPGDGGPYEYGDSAVHTYELPGSYAVELEVTDDAGDKDAAKGLVSVRNMENQEPPTARIVASETEGEGSLTVRFSCDCREGTAPIEAYLWDFGDMSVSTAFEVEHGFLVGRYRVRLTVVDQNGLSGSDCVEIVVTEEERNSGGCACDGLSRAGGSPGGAPPGVAWVLCLALLFFRLGSRRFGRG